MNLVHAAEQLAKAKGRSEYVMSIFMDIRGFSAFSKVNESPNIAIYVKKLFLKVLGEYFPDATYAKPTGDGLLIIYPYDEDRLSEVADNVVRSCLRCAEDFPRLCANEPMLNFPLPDKVGFGVSRGLACCLYENETIIDYSGHMLNLAARLNGLARPHGVVIDGSFATAGLKQEIFEQFERDSVYLKGVADESAVEVLWQRDLVIIAENNKKPLNKIHWVSQKIKFHVKDFDRSTGKWRHNLEYQIDESKGVKITMVIPMPTKSKPDRCSFFELKSIEYIAEPRPIVEFSLDEIRTLISKMKLKKTSQITVTLSVVRL